jgi:uncharacterized protein (DUF2147 family)
MVYEHDRSRPEKAAMIHRTAGWVAALTLSASLSSALAGGGKAPAETGLWIDDTGKGAIKIELCGTKLCGRIFWLKDTTDKSGQPLIDRNNPDPALKTRPICGLPVLGNLQRMTDGTYDTGWVYDPKVGKAYSVAIELANPNALRVTGYAGVKLFGKSFIWTRAKTELPPCDNASQEAGNAGDSLPWASR